MHRLQGLVLLSVLWLLSADTAVAEIWRCHQPHGNDSVVASEQNPGACEVFRLPENLRPYDPNRYFPEFYYNYYPGPQDLLTRPLLFPFHPQAPVGFVPPPAAQHTTPRIMPLLRRR